jgi:hypothetical protein
LIIILTVHGTSFHDINVGKISILTKMSAYEDLLKNATVKNLSFWKNGWALGIF